MYAFLTFFDHIPTLFPIFCTKISLLLTTYLLSTPMCLHNLWKLHGRRKVHDYVLLLLCKSSIWFTEKHIFKIIKYFLIHQNVPQIMSFHLRYGFIGQKILELWRQESWPFGPGWAATIARIRSWTSRLPCIPILSFGLFVPIDQILLINKCNFMLI